MIEPLLFNALMAGIGAALMTGPLGCFVVWKRLAYFGDALAHAALLGVVAGLLLQVHIALGILAVSVLMACLLSTLQRERNLAADALLGVLSHGALALGLVLLALFNVRVDVQAYLFGDILAVAQRDVWFIYGALALTAALLTRYWRPLVFMCVSEEMAQVEGVPTARYRQMLVLLIALAVAVSIQVVGIVLITSLLIIPAATARAFARSPVHMAMLATLAGVVAVCLGLGASFHFDTPAGPSIILAAIGLFALSRLPIQR